MSVGYAQGWVSGPPVVTPVSSESLVKGWQRFQRWLGLVGLTGSEGKFRVFESPADMLAELRALI